MFRRVLKLSFFLIMSFLILILVGELVGGTTIPIKDHHGNIKNNSIAKLEQVSLGDMNQWILIRGHDVSNPVLLWLHGGPGMAQMPISHAYNRALEKDFVIVNWDQRGAGKSNPFNFDEETLTFEQFLSDAHELTQYLKERFKKEKIYLLGHSWGSLIGSNLAYRYPQDYYAYIGVGQVVNNNTSHQIAYDWLKEEIKKESNQQDLEKFQSMSNPPFTDKNTYLALCKLVKSYGGGSDISINNLTVVALGSPEYSLGDFLRWKKAATRGIGEMWSYSLSLDLLNLIPEYHIPVYFLSGRNDYITPLQLIENYFSKVEATRGKELIIFEKAAHAPFMKETEKFNETIIRIKEETYP